MVVICKTENLEKLLDPYKNRGDYMLHTMTIIQNAVDSFT